MTPADPTSLLIARIEELLAIVRELDRPVAGQLRPGVPRRQVESVLNGPVPDEVATWFGWCDGVTTAPGQLQDDLNLVPGYCPLSLAEAVAARPHYREDPVLAPQWIPLLGGPSGDLYAAVWEPGAAPRVAGVLIGELTEVEFGSLAQMLDFFIGCYRSGAFAVSGNGHLTMDPEGCDEVYATLVGTA